MDIYLKEERGGDLEGLDVVGVDLEGAVAELLGHVKVELVHELLGLGHDVVHAVLVILFRQA